MNNGALKAAADQDRLAASTNRTTAALRAQRGVAGAVGGGAGKGKTGFLGLRSHELTNLSYQMNDVVGGLAMGQSPMQVLLQQGGQIAQIFPRAIGAVARFAPVLGAVTLALSPFIAKLQEVNARAKALAEFDRLLTRSGEGASYQAAALADTAARLDAYGGSLKDATASLTTFVNASVDPAYLERFGRAALDVSKVLGVDVKDASEKVTRAFTGNADAILSLDDELNFLTDSERAHIEVLRKSKRDAEARTYAFGVFERRYSQTAAQMRGPWSTVLTNFGGLWKGFVDRVNIIDLSGAKREINSLIGLIERLSFILPGVDKNSRDALSRQHAAIDRQIREQQALVDRGMGDIPTNGLPGSSTPHSNIDRLEEQRDVLNRRIAEIDQRAAANQPADTTLDPPKPANSDSGRSGASEAERRAEAQRNYNAELIRANEARTFETRLLGESAREAAILAEVESARVSAQSAGLTFATAQADAIRASVGAAYDARIEQQAFEAVSRSNLELAQARGEVETRAAAITRQLAEEGLTREMALYPVRADQIGQAWDLAETARQRAAADKAVNDLLAMRAELERQITFAQEQGDTGRAAELLSQLQGVNSSLLTAIDNIIAFYEAMGGPEAQAALLHWRGVQAEVKSVGDTAIITGKQINDSLASKGAGAFDQFAKSLVETRDLFGSLRDAFLQFAADFLREMAKLIIQKTIFNAISGDKSKGGAGGVGGMIASIIGRMFHTGGVVGAQGGKSRMVNPAVFAGATRYHTGGVAGLRSNEVPAILERGEEVLTARDARHIDNLRPGGASGSVKVVNVLDPNDLLDRALSSDAGERLLFNFVRNNRDAFQAALG